MIRNQKIRCFGLGLIGEIEGIHTFILGEGSARD